MIENPLVWQSIHPQFQENVKNSRITCNRQEQWNYCPCDFTPKYTI